MDSHNSHIEVGGLTMPPPPPEPPQPQKILGNPRSGIKYRDYTEEDMENAARAIMEGMPLRRASVTFNVPRTTLAERMGNKRPKLPPRDPKDKRHVTRHNWTEADMEQAIEAVRAGTHVREAARRFGVPPSNLNSRTRGRQPKELRGEVSRLTLKQESLLADWATAQGALGFPPTKDEVFDLAERVMLKSGTDKKLGRQWVTHWMRRWPKVEVLEWKSRQELEARKAEKNATPLFNRSEFEVVEESEHTHLDQDHQVVVD
ncbi:hypothetical protein DL770_004363 [Monosporascus sp. CRB-9-2]|nr:hypothetical protein DL770_004363 [Monosporascus sp. CRB-9-2]